MSRRAAPPAVVMAVAYVAGAVPFSNLAAHRRARVDLRDVGNGTVSGTALFEVAGFGPLVAAGLADIAKGAVGPLLAGRDRPGLAAAAATAAVAGHNWSPFLGGAGGRGISPAMGALGAHHPTGTVVLLGGLAAGRLARRTGLGSFVSFVVLVPVLARTGGRSGALAGAGVVVAILTKRVLGNRPPRRRSARTYLNRLVFDEDPIDRPS